jgi:hypothetical protein
MNCPGCNKSIELTWKRYLQNPFCRFSCQDCSAKFKFKRPISWYIWYVSWVSSYLGLILLSINKFNFTYIWEIYFGVTIFMITVYAIIDKRMESSYETKLR